MSPGRDKVDPGDASAVVGRRLWRLKYAVEWVIALVLAAALLPVGLLLAALVKATSRGPVFYTAERLGRNSRTFRLFKFRSMRAGSPEVRGPGGKIITTASDERLTPIGRFLRLGFDELPQLLNVLRGDMCLIGPRPDVVWQLDLYWPRERLRTAVLPGITGLTQVMGGRELDNHQNYELDVRYAVRSGFWTDVGIALLTAPYALGAKKIGQRFFRRHMEGLEAFSDAGVAAAAVASKRAAGPAVKTLLVLAAGPLQLPAITAARRMGLRVVAADGDPRAPGLALADQAYTIDIVDAEACLGVAQRERVNGVIHICSEVSMFAMGRINEVMKLRGLDTAVAVRATNKARMRRAFEAAGAPSPRSIGAATEEDALAAAKEIGWPLIVKPSRNSGSRGVTMLGGNEGADAFLAAFRRAVSESRDASAVIEHYVEGPEFSIEILTWDGQPHVLALTDKVTTEAPNFVETGHSQPSRQPAEVQAAIVDAAVRGVKALGIDWAAAHAEVKLAPDGPCLMEIGARLGGDFITTELVPRSTGIDMVEGAIRLALGEVPDLAPRHPPQGASIRYLTPRPGRVREIRGVERARQMPGVQIVEIDIAPGGVVPGLTSSLTRVGHVIAEGRTAEEAIAHAEAARDAIQIVTE